MTDYFEIQAVHAVVEKNGQQQRIPARSLQTANLADGLREAYQFSGKSGIIAPLPLIALSAPLDIPGAYTAHSEEHSGFGEFQGKKDYYVVTLHGLREGDLLLTPQAVEKAHHLYDTNNNGLTSTYALDLERTLGKGVFRELLQGNLPDGKRMDLFSLEQVLADEQQEHLQEFRPFGIVRTLAQARESTNGRKSSQQINPEEIVKKGNHDGQLITYCGSKRLADIFLRKVARQYVQAHVSLSHPFNKKFFDPEIAQGRILVFGDYSQNPQPFFCFLGNASISLAPRYVVVSSVVWERVKSEKVFG